MPLTHMAHEALLAVPEISAASANDEHVPEVNESNQRHPEDPNVEHPNFYEDIEESEDEEAGDGFLVFGGVGELAFVG